MGMTDKQVDELIMGEFKGVVELNTMDDIEQLLEGKEMNKKGYYVLIEGHGFTGKDSRNIYYKKGKIYEQHDLGGFFEYEEMTLGELKEQISDIYYTFKRVYRESSYEFLKYMASEVGVGIPMVY